MGLAPVAAGHPGERAAAELVARVRTELPAMAGLSAREELVAAAWLMSLRSARTRRAYAGSLASIHRVNRGSVRARRRERCPLNWDDGSC